MRRLLLLLALLPSCAPALLSPQTRTIHGVRVTYQQTTDLPPGKVASAQRLGDRCLIRVHPEHANAFILADELAHCLDQGHSKTFGHAGCVWRSYACDPAEQSEAWREAGTQLGRMRSGGEAVFACVLRRDKVGEKAFDVMEVLSVTPAPRSSGRPVVAAQGVRELAQAAD